MQKDTERAGDQAAIWDYFQNEGNDSFAGARTRLTHLARLARNSARNGANVLNIGVGSGLFEELALSLGLQVHTLDPNERAVASVAERLDLGDRARVGSCTEIPFADSAFDVVIASEVLEHLSDTDIERSLREIGRILAEDGAFIGTVPARERLADQEAVCPSCATRFHRWGHQQSFDQKRLRNTLAPHFASLRIDERPFPAWHRLNWKGRIAGGLKLTLNRLGVHGGGESLVFHARRDDVSR